MARSRKDGVRGGAHRHGHAGREYWSRRYRKVPMMCWGTGKTLTHRAERRLAKAETLEELRAEAA